MESMPTIIGEYRLSTIPGTNTLQATSLREYNSFSLPGLNLPLNWTPHDNYTKYENIGGDTRKVHFPAQGDGKNLVPTALDDAHIDGGKCALPITTLREFTMLHVMNEISDKLGWEEKVFDDTIAEKWKAEALATDGVDVTQKMMDWVIEELRYKVRLFKATGAISVYNGDVVKSDSAIPVDLKLALRAAIRSLEDIPQLYKDYHPGSDGKVLDLVHPSLFPLIYGRSRIIEDRLVDLDECVQSIGIGKTIQIRPDEEMQLDRKGEKHPGWGPYEPFTPYSKHFQWLPCEVDISGGEARITSYINNLHPHKHQELYSIIEKVITKTIPLWNMTLSPLVEEDTGYKRIDFELEFDPDPDNMDEDEKPQREDNENEDDYWDRLQDWEDNVRTAVQPEPRKFEPPREDPFDHSDESEEEPKKPRFNLELLRDYADRGLQVIVKLANIELTPENPNYPGGSWHVEGQLNEHICATALYYYDNENITTSHLAFRQQVQTSEIEEEIMYPQSVHGWLTEIFGCEQDGPAVQEVGSILCREDRLLTFPNILQHQVQPFKLADPTKPGHRKILALFLVDPGIRIISTANLPPQQRDWWSESVSKAFSETGEALGKLSNELKDKVFAEVDDFPIGIEEAKEIRLKLMDERKSYVVEHGRSFEKNQFSLCEH